MKFSSVAVLRGLAAAGAVAVIVTGPVGPADAAPPRPDLVVSAVKWAPLSPVAGQQIRFSAVVSNQGEAATPAGTAVEVAFVVDGHEPSWSSATTTAVAPGQSVTLIATGWPAGSATWTAAAGPHAVRAVVDGHALIGESREGNNSLSVQLSVAAGLSVRPGGPGLLVGFASLTQPSVLTTSITGDLYAGCFDQSGVLV